MAVQATLAPMSKGAWMMLSFALMIPVIGFLGPYALRMATSPWAWTGVSKDSLTGTWVGTLSLQETGGAPASPVQIPTMIEMHMQVFTWLPHVAGTVKTCHSGVVSESSYTLGDVRLGTSDGDAVSLKFGTSAAFSPIKGVRRDNAFTVEMRSPAASGVLHKGSSTDFDALCR